MKELSFMVASARLHFDYIQSSSEKWYRKAVELAQLINSFSNIETIPLVPQSNTMFVRFQASREKLYKVNEEIAAEHDVWMFDFFIDDASGRGSVSELVVYDAAFQISNEKLSVLFTFLSRRLLC